MLSENIFRSTSIKKKRTVFIKNLGHCREILRAKRRAQDDVPGELHINPFQYEGKLSGENYSIPKKIDLSSKGTPHGEALPIAVSVKFNKGDLANITQLSLSYNLDGSESTWTPAASVDTEEGLANLPLGAKAISIAYYNNGWFAACQIIPATKISKDDSCSLLYTVATRWSVDGKGECDITY